HNKLNSIPRDIRFLLNLTDLCIGHNRLEKLPSELCLLPALQRLSAFPNPFMHPSIDPTLFIVDPYQVDVNSANTTAVRWHLRVRDPPGISCEITHGAERVMHEAYTGRRLTFRPSAVSDASLPPPPALSPHSLRELALRMIPHSRSNTIAPARIIRMLGAADGFCGGGGGVGLGDRRTCPHTRLGTPDIVAVVWGNVCAGRGSPEVLGAMSSDTALTSGGAVPLEYNFGSVECFAAFLRAFGVTTVAADL
ncbi:hypothetical protein HDU84_005289, partial [Entophlyctis sp. JEL0112]